MQKTLPARLSIETLGNVSNPVFEKGSSLPVDRKIIFSTAEDDQETVGIHILYGDNTISFDNVSLIKYQISGIPKKPRGKPQIELKVSIDADMVLTVSATELTTKNSVEEKKIDLSNITPPSVKYRVATEGLSPALFDDMFQELFQGFVTKEEEHATAITDDLGKLIYWLSKDVQFRKLFFTTRNKALEGYTLTNSQLQALQMITPDIFEVAGFRKILNALQNAETLIRIDPSAQRCDACNGLGFKATTRKILFGSSVTVNTCTKCGGNGFHRT